MLYLVKHLVFHVGVKKLSSCLWRKTGEFLLKIFLFDTRENGFILEKIRNIYFYEKG